MSEQPTGNPVFDYKAGSRTSSAKLQKFLLQGGLALFVGGTFALMVARTSGDLRSAIAVATGLGFVLIAASLAWGFFWRKRLQRDFRRAFGAESAQ